MAQAENTPHMEYSTKSELFEETDSIHDTNSTVEVIKIHEKESTEVRDEHFLDDKSILPIQVSNFQLEPSLSLTRKEWIAGNNDALMSVTGSDALIKKEVFGTKKEMVHHMFDKLSLGREQIKLLKPSLIPKSWKFKFKIKVKGFRDDSKSETFMFDEVVKGTKEYTLVNEIEELLRHRQAGSSVGIILFEASTTQFNRMSMQIQTLQDELVEIQRFKQRKVHKTWWYKYKNGVSQGPTIMDSLEKVCNRIIVQICELGSYVSPTQEMLRLLPKSWKFKFKHGVSKREVHNWGRNKSFTCELLFKWTVLLFFGSLLRPPELKHAFMNLEGKVLSRREICCRKSAICFGQGLSLHPTVQLESDQRLSLKQYHH